MNRFATTTVAILIITGAMLTPAAHAADWPGFRGADRTDKSTETNLLNKFTAKGPRLLWTHTDAGIGYSGPAVVGNRIYMMGAWDNKEQLFALDAKTGKRVWSVALGEVLANGWGDGPRGTPTVSGNYVYAVSGLGRIVCVNAKTGKGVWDTTMAKLGGKTPKWGYTESLLIDQDRVICTPGGKKGAMAALDAKSGKVIWQSKSFTDDAQYASPIVVEHAGKRQYIQLTMKSIVGLDAKNGKTLWKSDFPGKTAVIPTPIYSDNHVFVSAGYGVGCKMVKLDNKNNVTDVYQNKNLENHHGGVILHEGYLYGHHNRLGWVCVDFKTGEIVWQNKSREAGKGAVTYADGKLFLYTEAEGNVVMIDASPKGYNQRGLFQIPRQTELRNPKGKIWTHPVIANGKLYLRDQDLVFCYDITTGSLGE